MTDGDWTMTGRYWTTGDYIVFKSDEDYGHYRLQRITEVGADATGMHLTYIDDFLSLSDAFSAARYDAAKKREKLARIAADERELKYRPDA